MLSQVASTLRVPQTQLGDRVAALLEELKNLKKQASSRRTDGGDKVSVDDLVAGATVRRQRDGGGQGRRQPVAR